MSTVTFQKRFYRKWVSTASLVPFEVVNKESDLYILAERDLSAEAHAALADCRGDIERYVAREPEFLWALTPVNVAPNAAAIIREMAMAGRAFEVGPMAAVAGAVAERVGRALLKHSESVIVENGGDIFVRAEKRPTLALYAGDGSPFSGKILFEVDAGEGIGVCTSSATVGHSLSFGKADAVVVVARNAAIADAAATAICNSVKRSEDVDVVIRRFSKNGTISGLIIAIGERIGFWGDIYLK
jgi:hypothetical protein